MHLVIERALRLLGRRPPRVPLGREHGADDPAVRGLGAGGPHGADQLRRFRRHLLLLLRQRGREPPRKRQPRRQRADLGPAVQQLAEAGADAVRGARQRDKRRLRPRRGRDRRRQCRWARPDLRRAHGSLHHGRRGAERDERLRYARRARVAGRRAR